MVSTEDESRSSVSVSTISPAARRLARCLRSKILRDLCLSFRARWRALFLARLTFSFSFFFRSRFCLCTPVSFWENILPKRLYCISVVLESEVDSDSEDSSDTLRTTSPAARRSSLPSLAFARRARLFFFSRLCTLRAFLRAILSFSRRFSARWSTGPTILERKVDGASTSDTSDDSVDSVSDTFSPAARLLALIVRASSRNFLRLSFSFWSLFLSFSLRLLIAAALSLAAFEIILLIMPGSLSSDRIDESSLSLSV